MNTQSALINPYQLPPKHSWSKAEECFVKYMTNGDLCTFGQTRPMPDGKTAQIIRAEFIGFFACGGDNKNTLRGNIIQLQGAWVRGALKLEHLPLSCSLIMANCHFDSGITMAHSELRFLNLEGSRLTNGFVGAGMRIASDLIMDNGFVSDNSVFLLDANIGGTMACEKGVFQKQLKDDVVLGADRVKVGGNVRLMGIVAEGGVRLPGAKIGGSLYCDGGKFSPCEAGKAILADEIRVENHLFMRDGFVADGELCLPGADIKGCVYCDGGEFKGKVRLDGANIKRDLICVGGKFINENGPALDADMVKVGGNVLMRDNFSAKGAVNFAFADIGGLFSCEGGNFRDGFSAQGAKIKDMLVWRKVKGGGVVNLGLASVDAFADDAESRKRFKFYLNEFAYERLLSTENVKSRIEWLSRRPAGVPFSPQPFEQAAKILFKMGYDEDARAVKYAMEKRITAWHGPNTLWIRFAEWRRTCSPAWRKAWLLGRQTIRKTWRLARWFVNRPEWPPVLRWVLEKTTGYNYQLGRMLATSAVVIVLNAGVFGVGNSLGYIVPHQTVVLKDETYQTLVKGENVAGVDCRANQRPTDTVACLFPDYPRFSAFWFSMDVFIPVFALHQEAYWYPQPANTIMAVIFKFFYWVEIVVGWLLTSVFVLTATGILQKSQKSGE